MKALILSITNVCLRAPVGAFVFGCMLTLGTGLVHAEHSWSSYHWARTSPVFTLALGDNLSQGWRALLLQTSYDWNNPTLVGPGLTTPLLTEVITGRAGSKCRAVAGTTQVCNSTYGNRGWLGLATIYLNANGHIIRGLAKMNDTYFNMSRYNNPNEKLHVMCQEVAHTFGLTHQSETGESLDSCMDYFSNTGVNASSTLSTGPNAHDFEELNSIYGHLDTIDTTAAQRSSSGTAAAIESSEEPNSWGKLMSQSANGRSSTYKQKYKDGSSMVTHVYWTEETASVCKNCDHRDQKTKVQ